MEVSWKRAVPEDARRLAPLMRESDKQEILAMGEPVERSVLLSIRMSVGEAWVISFDGEPAAIFGVVPCSYLTGYAVPWLLTTEIVTKHPKTFYKLSKSVIYGLRRHYARLGNVIDSRYTASLRWAKRLGFTVGEARAYGPNGVKFHQIMMEGS